MISQEPQQRSIREAAAEWAVLLADDALDDGQQQALQQWLQADARHAEALAFARRTWSALGNLPADKPARHRALPVAPELARHPRRHARLRRWGAAACLALLLGGLGLNQSEHLLLPLLADHRTASGEVRSLTLADGSEVTLDSASAIRLDYSAGQRRIELLAGAAIFQVAPQADRPFVVEAAGGSTQALGTRFVVQREAGAGALVGVLEHAVQVKAADQQRRLQEGDSLRYDATGLHDVVLDLQRVTSWQRGLLVFDRQPLGQVIEQLNRYRPGYILIGSDAIAQREVSGVFRLDGLDDALATLTREMQLQHRELMGVSLIY
ncbi:FecR family protein [Ectopseudomonas alcaliphila]|uniref:FecR domain-containing protein n=1 Tax=Ectopseudomonas alcaliphila TaxID=101564 RepID=A0ABU4PZH5_9GAMM|nr:FecR domain-containing protein [Pseudomonas alcaliphila]MDX5993306.1 FecR domain-containing protein [Pseudomonas alcaliphila]